MQAEMCNLNLKEIELCKDWSITQRKECCLSHLLTKYNWLKTEMQAKKN